MRFFPAIALIAIASVCLVTSNSASWAVVIDDYTTSNLGPVWMSTRTTVGTTANSDGPPLLTGVLGGTRDLSVIFQAVGGPAPSVQGGLDTTFANGVLFYNSSNANGNLLMTYDANGTGLGFDATGETHFVIDFSSFDFANANPLPVTFTLEDGDGEIVTQTQNLGGPFPPPASVLLNFALDDFTGPATFNFDNIFSIDVLFDANLSHEFFIESISSVATPEPASIAAWVLLGVISTLGGFVAIRRRK